MPDGPPRGRIVWHELLTSDPDAAIAFYPKVVGWGVTVFPGSDPPYRLWTMQGVPMGGVMAIPGDAQAPPNWLMYVAVPDVDETVAQAARLGARTWVPGTDIPDVGRFAVLGDPQGATFAVYKPSMPGAGSDEAALGDFSWHELAATDWKAAAQFYRALFGWEHTSTFDMGTMGTYSMFRRGGGVRTLGGMYGQAGAAPAHWLCYVRVPDAAGAAKLARRHGGTVVHGPMEVPGGDRIAMLADPQGAAFAVHTPVVRGMVLKAVPAPKKKSATSRKSGKVKRKPAKRAAPKRRTAAKRRPRGER